MLFHGMNIIPSRLATQVKVEFRVVRASLHMKRRKNWMVQRCEHQVPCAFQVGDTIYMHPDLVDRLKQEVKSHE